MPGSIDDWDDDEFRMFEDLDLPQDAESDRFVQLAYDMAFFDEHSDYETRMAMREFLFNFLQDEYGFDFNAEFDWDDYRAWYSAA